MWLAIYVPDLPLQALSYALDQSVPVAIFEHKGRRDVVVACNRIATQSGVRVFATLAEASALVNQLVALPRDLHREKEFLHRLADSLASLTPNICVDGSFGLLLDVGGSLMLHDGSDSLLRLAMSIIDEALIRAHAVLAPTSRGARWLAKAHRQLIVETRIDNWLDDLPIVHTDISPEVITELRNLNLHHLAAVRCLNSAELNQRFGTELTIALDQAYGMTQQSLPFRKAALVFHQYVEFLDLAREQAHWWPGITVLLRQLQDFLRQHGKAAIALRFTFSNGHQQSTALTIASGQGAHHAAIWLRLLQVRVEHDPILHEISRIDLLSHQFRNAEAVELDFFDQSKAHQQIWQSLLDLVASRLGGQRFLTSPRHHQNALPESQNDTSTTHLPSYSDSLRPPWLIDPPKLLQADIMRRLRHSLSLRQPERIEANWSAQGNNGSSVLRDYYIVSADHHRYWWVFRERNTDRWFLQGIFA